MKRMEEGVRELVAQPMRQLQDAVRGRHKAGKGPATNSFTSTDVSTPDPSLCHSSTNVGEETKSNDSDDGKVKQLKKKAGPGERESGAPGQLVQTGLGLEIGWVGVGRVVIVSKQGHPGITSRPHLLRHFCSLH